MTSARICLFVGLPVSVLVMLVGEWFWGSVFMFFFLIAGFLETDR